MAYIPARAQAGRDLRGEVVERAGFSRTLGRHLAGGLQMRQSFGRASKAGRSVFPDAPGGAHAVAPTDLLAFLVGSSEIGNTDFVDPAAGNCGDLAGHFRLEPETIFLDSDALDDLTAKDLEAGLHVREIQICKRV